MSRQKISDDNPILAAWQQQLEHARANPFLFQLLLKQWQRILKRLAYFYAQLASLPRRRRRALQRALATSLIGAAMLLALSGAPIVHAASITVSGACTLDEAITNANDDAATFPDCAAGSGPDTIYLTGNVTLGTDTPGALPGISSEIILEGNNFYVSGANTFRVFYVYNTGDFTVNDTTVRDGNVGGYGGGILVSGYASLELNDSIVSGNESFRGGGISSYAATVTLNNSAVSGNYGGVGGGIYNRGALYVNNSTLSGNTSAYGGGIYNYGNATLNNTTVTGNVAVNQNHVGGIHNAGTLNLHRSLVSGNAANYDGNEIGNSGTVNGGDYNLFGHSGETNGQAFAGFTPGGTDINATSDGTNTPLASILNPTLDNNGGPTQTHALVTGSPALDKAPSAACSAAPINGIDQRGAARNFDGNNSASSNECDIGAVEFHNPQTNCALSTGNDITIANVTFNFSALGTLTCVTAEEMGTNHLLATPSLMTGDWWFIKGDGTGFNTSITLPLTGADSADMVCKNLGGMNWDCDGSGGSNVVARAGVTAFSDWAAQNNAVTAVNVTNFTARARDEKNILKWQTTSESQIAGFNVFRKTGKGEWKQANAKFKQAKHAGDAAGANYRFADKKVLHGKVYRYKIQVKYLDGHDEWTEIVRVVR